MQISRYVVVSYMHQWAKIGKNSVLMKKKFVIWIFFFKPCYSSSSSSGENKYIFLCKKRLTKDVVAAKYKKVKPKCIFFGIQAIHLFYYNQNPAWHTTFCTISYALFPPLNWEIRYISRENAQYDLKMGKYCNIKWMCVRWLQNINVFFLMNCNLFLDFSPLWR